MKTTHKFIEYKPGKFRLFVSNTPIEDGIEEAWLPYRVAMLHFAGVDVSVQRLDNTEAWHPAPRRTQPIEINTPPIPGVMSTDEIDSLLAGLDGDDDADLSASEKPESIDLLEGL